MRLFLVDIFNGLVATLSLSLLASQLLDLARDTWHAEVMPAWEWLAVSILVVRPSANETKLVGNLGQASLAEFGEVDLHSGNI